MSGEIKGTVDASTVLLRLKRMGPDVRAQLVRETERQALRLADIAKRKVSGSVLKNRTGTLRRKINGTVSESETAITGRVGLRLAYAHAHEYGFDGVVNVREHLSHSRTGTPFTVRAHTMHMRIPERSFLRSTLREEAPTVSAALRRALAAGLAGEAA